MMATRWNLSFPSYLNETRAGWRLVWEKKKREPKFLKLKVSTPPVSEKRVLTCVWKKRGNLRERERDREEQQHPSIPFLFVPQRQKMQAVSPVCSCPPARSMPTRPGLPCMQGRTCSLIQIRHLLQEVVLHSFFCFVFFLLLGGGFLFLCFKDLVARPFTPPGPAYTFHETAGDSPQWAKVSILRCYRYFIWYV